MYLNINRGYTKSFAFFINVALGVMCFYFGLIISPRASLFGNFANIFEENFFSAISFGFSSASISYICGLTPRMMGRSRVDYFVNSCVSAVLGGIIAVFIIYAFRFSVIGRWVFAVAVLSYAFFCYLVGIVLVSCGWANVRVLTMDDYLIKQVLDSLGGLVRNMHVEIMVLPWDKLRGIVCNDKKISEIKTYILLDGIHFQGDKNCTLSLGQLSRYVTTLDDFVESEFGLVNPFSQKNRFWWEIQTNLRRGMFPVVKRLLDLSMVIILAIPAMILIAVGAIFIKLDSRGPVFYRQVRIGQFRIPFSVIKLRTMGVFSEANGAQWATIGDPRITRVGKILRMSRIDELPQLWNIAVGEMSLVGPRPERPEFYEVIEREIPSFGLRLCCKPGLTGWAQINYPYGASIQDSKMKMLYDLFYIKNACFMLEMQIMIRTVLAMVKGAR